MYDYAVLISINYKWCKLIIDRLKVMELRKIIPNITPSYRVLMYCTKDGPADDPIVGKVFGEFVCKDIYHFKYGEQFDENKSCIMLRTMGQLGKTDAWDYAGFKDIHGLVISDLDIYENPKPLSRYAARGTNKIITTAPMNWRYVIDAGDRIYE